MLNNDFTGCESTLNGMTLILRHYAYPRPLLASLVTYIYIQQFFFFQENEDTTNQQLIPYAVVDVNKKKKNEDDKQQKVHN